MLHLQQLSPNLDSVLGMTPNEEEEINKSLTGVLSGRHRVGRVFEPLKAC